MEWNNYHDYNDIENFIAFMNMTKGGYLREEVVAFTGEGRPVRVVRITNPTATGPKKKIWIEAGEWKELKDVKKINRK